MELPQPIKTNWFFYNILEQTVYTQEGVLRGCANLTGSFEDNRENCTKSKKVRN